METKDPRRPSEPEQGLFGTLDRRFRELARTNPYVLAGIAAGVGFLVGSRSRSRLLRLAVSLAGDLVVSELARVAAGERPPTDAGSASGRLASRPG